MMYKSQLQNYDQFIEDNDILSVVCVQMRIDNAHFIIQSGSKLALYETKEHNGTF